LCHDTYARRNKNKIGQKLIAGTSARSNVVASRIHHSTALLLCKGIITITREHGIGENGIGEKLCIALHALRNIGYIIIRSKPENT